MSDYLIIILIVITCTMTFFYLHRIFHHIDPIEFEVEEDIENREALIALCQEFIVIRENVNELMLKAVREGERMGERGENIDETV